MPRNPNESVYQARNRRLLELGFDSYAAYLASPLWKSIRARVLRRDKYKCQCCGEPATEAHHRQYNRPTMRGEAKFLRNIVAVCRQCHVNAEFDGERKTDIREANERLGVPTSIICQACKKVFPPVKKYYNKHLRKCPGVPYWTVQKKQRAETSLTS